MAFSERIKLVIDVATGNSSSQLGKLRTDLGNAEGAFGKMGVAGRGAFDLVKQNAALAVTAIGTALVGFGAKAVAEFQDVALGAGELRDALGVTAEEASRLQEVAGDVGISVGDLESAIGRMNRSAASTPQAFDDIGAAIVRNADGSINVTETFIATAEALDKIPDAARRAEAGQRIFGRGWQNISELIMSGADGIREAMASVEAGKIVDDGDIDDARRYRDAIDALKGNMEELSTSLGSTLVPALADAAEELQKFVELGKSLELPGFIEWAQNVRDEFNVPILPHEQITWAAGQVGDQIDYLAGEVDGKLGPAFQLSQQLMEDNAAAAEDLSPPLQAAADLFGVIADATGESAEAAEEHADAVKENTRAVQEHNDELEHMAELEREAADAFLATVEARRSAADAQYAVNAAQRDFNAALVEAAAVLPTASPDDYAATLEGVAMSAADAADAHVRLATEQAAARNETLLATETGDVWRSSMLEQASAASGPLRDAILDYIASVEGIPAEKLSDIRALIDQGKIAEAERVLNEASRKRDAEIQARATGDADTVINRWARTRDATIRVRAVRQGGGFIAPSGAIFEAEGGYSPGAVNVAGETGQLEFAGRGMVSSPTVVQRGTRVTGVRDTALLVRDMVESNLRVAAALERRSGTDGASIAAAVAAGVERAIRAEARSIVGAVSAGRRH